MAIGPHEDLTREVLKCAFKVRNTLGAGFLEKVYENSLMVALKQEGLEAAQQVPLRVHFQGVLVGEYVADIVVARAVLVELKASEENPPIYVAQVLNYLKATNLPVGLLINFGRPRLFYRRLWLPGSRAEQESISRDAEDAKDKGEEWEEETEEDNV